MEIWNNVFIQYNRNPDRSLTPLPAQHVDTGMGLERIIQVLQGKDDNYGIDLFDPFWAKLKELSGITYSGKYPKTNSADPVAEAADAQLRHDIAFRVIADHVRCLTFALTDGAVPSNEGRGYVLRRILRRAVRFGRQQLELKDPFLHKLVPVVVEAMGGAFPELKKEPDRVAESDQGRGNQLRHERSNGAFDWFEFAQRSAIGKAIADKRGWRFWNVQIESGTPETAPAGELNLTDQAGKSQFIPIPNKGIPSFIRNEGLSRVLITATDAFKLHDTYGFPIDLTRIMAEERGMTVDLAGYEKLMEEARENAPVPAARKATRGCSTSRPMCLAKLAEAAVAPTDDSAKFNAMPIGATVKAIWDGTSLIEHDPRRRGGRPRRGGHPRPDQLLRRDGRPGRRHRASCARPGAVLDVTATPRGRRVRAARRATWSRGTSRSATTSPPRSPACGRGPRRTTRPPTWPTGPCAKCWATACSRRARWSIRKSCASTSRTASRWRTRKSAGSRRW